jgi:hypothetical protein
MLSTNCYILRTDQVGGGGTNLSFTLNLDIWFAGKSSDLTSFGACDLPMQSP